MSNLAHLPVEQVNSLEARMYEAKMIKQQRDAYAKQYEAIRQDLIETYFKENHIYVNADGMLLGEYSSCIRQNLKTAEFKKAHPALFDEFSDLKEVWTLNLK